MHVLKMWGVNRTQWMGEVVQEGRGVEQRPLPCTLKVPQLLCLSDHDHNMVKMLFNIARMNNSIVVAENQSSGYAM